MSRNYARNRLDYIDLLEFIAISIILIYHCTTYQFNILKSSSISTWVYYTIRSLYSAAVPLFFFVNGYLLFNRAFLLKKHIIKTVKIIILTIVWGFINVLIMMPIDHTFLSPKETLMAVWTWKSGWINQFWFMGVLVCIYIFFPILKCAFDTDRKVFLYFVIVCMLMTFGNKVIGAIATIAAHELLGYPEQILENAFNIFNPFRGVYIWYSFVYFCCGGLSHSAITHISIHQKKFNSVAVLTIPTSMVLLTCWACYLTFLNGELWDNVWGGQDSVFAFAIVASLFVLSLNYHPRTQWFKKVVYLVSANTLGIYYIHELYIHMLLPIARKKTLMQNPISTIVIAFGIMAISLLTSMIIKKTPVIKKLLT